MATVEAVKGVKTEFLGGADDIVCIFTSPAKAVQVEAEGFTLNDSTITVKVEALPLRLIRLLSRKRSTSVY